MFGLWLRLLAQHHSQVARVKDAVCELMTKYRAGQNDWGNRPASPVDSNPSLSVATISTTTKEASARGGNAKGPLQLIDSIQVYWHH
jgi:hypothetical protein